MVRTLATRRMFLTGLVAAPAVVAVSRLMRVRGRPLVLSEEWQWGHELLTPELADLLERRIAAAREVFEQAFREACRKIYEHDENFIGLGGPRGGLGSLI